MATTASAPAPGMANCTAAVIWPQAASNGSAPSSIAARSATGRAPCSSTPARWPTAGAGAPSGRWAGSAAARAGARRRLRAPPGGGALGGLVRAGLALLLAAGVLLGHWAGSDTSLASALSQAAHYLPAGQRLES